MTSQSRFFVPYTVTSSLSLSLAGRKITPLEVAQSLAANFLAEKSTNVAVVFRSSPQPLIAVFGYFDASAETKLKALGWQVDWSLSHLRYVDYRQAEADCTLLAEALVARFGQEELQRLRFTAIPRGGLIVLGILSYILKLNPRQLSDGNTNEGVPVEGPLVVVDDCALTGLRFGQFLKQFPSQEVVFAHLYSHPDLRQSILEQEEQVVACLSAHDLHDYAPEQKGSAYEAWRQRVSARSHDQCYWVGLTDHICFPWNEPDFALWNPVTEREEPGWRVLPPDLCLKNRVAIGEEPLPVQIQPEARGPLKPPADVLFGTLTNELIIGKAETGVSYTLEGTAAAMWQAIIRQGNIDDVVADLLERYDVERTALRADVADFVAQLQEIELLIDESE